MYHNRFLRISIITLCTPLCVALAASQPARAGGLSSSDLHGSKGGGDEAAAAAAQLRDGLSPSAPGWTALGGPSTDVPRLMAPFAEPWLLGPDPGRPLDPGHSGIPRPGEGHDPTWAPSGHREPPAAPPGAPPASAAAIGGTSSLYPSVALIRRPADLVALILRGLQVPIPAAVKAGGHPMTLLTPNQPPSTSTPTANALSFHASMPDDERFTQTTLSALLYYGNHARGSVGNAHYVSLTGGGLRLQRGYTKRFALEGDLGLSRSSEGPRPDGGGNTHFTQTRIAVAGLLRMGLVNEFGIRLGLGATLSFVHDDTKGDSVQFEPRTYIGLSYTRRWQKWSAGADFSSYSGLGDTSFVLLGLRVGRAIM